MPMIFSVAWGEAIGFEGMDSSQTLAVAVAVLPPRTAKTIHRGKK